MLALLHVTIGSCPSTLKAVDLVFLLHQLGSVRKSCLPCAPAGQREEELPVTSRMGQVSEGFDRACLIGCVNVTRYGMGCEGRYPQVWEPSQVLPPSLPPSVPSCLLASLSPSLSTFLLGCLPLSLPQYLHAFLHNGPTTSSFSTLPTLEIPSLPPSLPNSLPLSFGLHHLEAQRSHHILILNSKPLRNSPLSVPLSLAPHHLPSTTVPSDPHSQISPLWA